jgi:hypothetical protein
MCKQIDEFDGMEQKEGRKKERRKEWEREEKRK